MRRKDREITDTWEMENILQAALVCRIAMNDEQAPYVVPVNFGYRDGSIYVHSAPEGKKIDLLQRDNRVCFEVETDLEVLTDDKPCKWGMKFRSVIGHGKAFVLRNAEEKRDALGIIFRHYASEPFRLPEGDFDNLVVIKIAIDSMTGKKARI